MIRHRIEIKKTAVAVVAVLTLLVSGCDEGKIYPSEQTGSNEGVTVRMTGRVSGITDFYGSGYSIALAVFSGDSDFAEVSKNIDGSGEEVTLSNAAVTVGKTELCVLNTLRKRVFTLVEGPEITGDGGEIITFDIGDADASPFNVINEKVFATTCIQCHGGTGHSAAGLNLDREKAYSMLVGIESTVEEGMLRVDPGYPSGSTLWEAIATDVSAGWSFSHSNLLEPERIGFITNWIEKGAEQ